MRHGAFAVDAPPAVQLPVIAPGKRFTLPRPPGSADALLLARHAEALAARGERLAIVSAEPADTQRLDEELRFFAPALRCAVFPDWETLPYDNFSPHQDLVSERLATLWRVMQRKDVDVLLLPATTALQRLAPPAFLAAYTFEFRQKQKLDERALRAQLTLAGYQHVSQVVGPGEYAVRGGLIDLFPMGSPVPYRVDLFDDEVDSIRTFDPDTQRSLYPVPEVRLLPGREFPLDEAARAAFRARWRERMEGDPTRSRIYKDIGAGLAPAGIEYYLPLFFDQTATLFDHLGGGSALVLHGEVAEALERFWADTRERHRFLQHDPERPILPPEALYLKVEDFFALAQPLPTLALRGGGETAWARPLPDVAVDRAATEPLARLERHLGTTAARVLLVAESEGRRETLLDLLRDHKIAVPSVATLAEFTDGDARDEKVAIVAAPLAAGFHWHEPEAGIGLQLVTETELFASAPGARRRRKQERVSDVDTLIKDLAELKVGDPVVHVNHGIGRYRGLVEIDTGEGASEFLHLEYADKATLYVPVAQLHLIGRYTGVSADEAPLHRLGSAQWDKARRKAAEQVRDAAAELLALYACRAAREGHAHRYLAHEYEAFAASFGFEETADQRAAIHAVVQDLISPRPMDRLVCGDVGFGKTEVALRAAFVAVTGGKQVALLAPTTLLAEQHYQTIADRFGPWPVKVAELSRFRSPKEVKAALEGLADGTIDIAVGTHKLLSPDVKFKRLGLLIIDEEHRFGVRHKEAMKALRAEVDVLTLTATPIPRTLGMALEGLRDLSVIATAPQRRLAIKTFVRNESSGTIREAVLRELKRGGQVFFLHNEVETIEHRAAKLAALLPEARIAIAHGQMPERQLEAVMRDFVAQRHNLLVCSTIIETGIDVPSANTIVITRADKFGLAQLHQLRGRVGRSHHQAYAYLLVPDVEALSKAAEQRLQAIQEMEELGSGFYLAMHDLEIRGAGEILGEHQSGNMMEVGFQLFNEMLAEAVRALKSGKEPDLLSPAGGLFGGTTEVNLHAPALLPDAYCGDVHVRLSLYKRLATAGSAAQIDALLEEVTDRFGKLPAQGQVLFDTHRLRVLAKPYGVLKVDAGPKLTTITFRPNPPIDARRIIELVQGNRSVKLAGNDKLRVERPIAEPAVRAQLVRDLLRSLGQPAAQTD